MVLSNEIYHRYRPDVIIGLITELSAAVWAPDYKQVVAFGILVLVMLLRPQGLLAKRGALAAAG